MGLAQMMLRRSLTVTRPSCEQRPVGHALAKDLVFAVVAHGGGAQLVNLVDGTMGAFSGSTKPTWSGPFLNVPGGAATVSWVDWGASKQALTRDLALGPFSILARVLWRSGAGGFAERSDGNTVNAGWEVCITTGGNVGLVFVRASTDLNSFGPALPANKWVNVAICYPGTLVSTDVKFYLDGVVQTHSADQNGSGAQGSDFANPMTVGRQSFAQVGAPAGTFNGLIDSIMILRRYLRAEEVRAWMVDPYLSFRQRRGRGLGLDVSPPATGITGSQKAYSQALAGVMRAGSSRANVHGKAVFVSIGGVQYATGRAGAAQVENETLSITENDADTPNTASFAVRGVTPQDGQEVLITLGSVNNRERLFAGTINTDSSGYVGTPANGRDQVSAIDYTWQLTRETISRRWTNESATVIAEEILADAGRGFSSRRVEAGLPVLAEFTVTDQTHLSAINHLAERIGATLKTTSRRSVRFGITPGMGGTDPTPITAASALLTEMTDFSVTRDLSQVITRQPVEGGGSIALTEIAPGETILPLAVAAWYNPIGGTVVSGPQRISYGAVEQGRVGIFAGPSQAPSVKPSATVSGGGSIETGSHNYAYTFKTASGETLPSPIKTVATSTTAMAPPTDTPVVVSASGNGTGLTAGNTYKFRITYASDITHETTVGPESNAWVADGSAPVDVQIAAPPVAGALLTLYRNIGGTYYRDGSGYSTYPNLGGRFASVGAQSDAELVALNNQPPGSNTATYATVALGFAIGPTGTTQRKIYRTPADAAQLKLLTTVANNAATTYSDSAADSTLGANVPTSDTSGLAVVTGQINGGTTSLLTAGVGDFPSGGGWVIAGEQRIRYTGISGNTLTGVPASGLGAITTPIRYGDHLDLAPALTGIPASGAGSILYPIKQGDPVNLRVVIDDLAAQATLAALIGPHLEDGVLVDDDGIIEGPLIQDGRLSETEARARGQAVIDQRQAIDVAVSLTGHDLNLHAGGILAVDVAAPACVGSFKLTQVTIDTFLPARWPTRKARASSKRYTLEDLLRRAREATR